MIYIKFFRLLIPVLLAGALAHCDALRTQQFTRQKTITLHVDKFPVTAEVVATPEQRERGLMFRTSLGENEGMLFVFPKPETQAFWMKNTLIPLDLAYFDANGFLTDIHTMEVESKTPDNQLKTYPSSEPVPYALEVNKGWFRKRNIRLYAKLKLPYSIKGL